MMPSAMQVMTTYRELAFTDGVFAQAFALSASVVNESA